MLAFEIKAPDLPGDIQSFVGNAWFSPDAKFLVHSVPYRLSSGPESERDRSRLTFFDLKKRGAIKAEDFPGDVVKVLWSNEG